MNFNPKYFLIEFATIVFLFITIPLWFPILTILLAGGIGFLVFLAIIIALFSSISNAHSCIINNQMIYYSNEVMGLCN